VSLRRSWRGATDLSNRFPCERALQGSRAVFSDRYRAKVLVFSTVRFAPNSLHQSCDKDYGPHAEEFCHNDVTDTKDIKEKFCSARRQQYYYEYYLSSEYLCQKAWYT
jgi:hypothetical protein